MSSASVPEFYRSTVIPDPTAALRVDGECTVLATIATDEGFLLYWWWESQRKVILWSQKHRLWLLQEDMTIRESIADALDWSPAIAEVDNLMIFDGPERRHGMSLPERLVGYFLDCEWSDYACDHRPVSGHVFKKVLPPAPVYTGHTIFPVFRASRWEDEESLSDDETPPSPRKWRSPLRKTSWK